MTEQTENWDRRREPRYPVAGRVTCTREGLPQTFRAWLSDTTRSTVSIVAASTHQPALGEEIELISPDRNRQRCRVLRIAPYGENLSLVACRALASRTLNLGQPVHPEV
ncbi:MAG: hypothetical protein KKB50_05695 [Planctomycetes bacterium]|nr:hypothetical protein [Planctomycetota bacterium]